MNRRKNKVKTRILAGILAALTLLAAIVTAPIGAQTGGDREAVTVGDVNGDGAINARDVIALLRAILGSIEVDTLAADVVPDEVLNARDAIRLMQYLVGYDVTLGEQFFEVETDAQIAPAEDASLDMLFVDSIAKYSPTATVSGEATFVMSLARNEKESCQVELVDSVGHTGLNAKLSPFTNGRGEELESQLLFEDYIKIVSKDDGRTQIGDLIPDRLPPIEAVGEFKIEANKLQGLYIEVAADENARAGLYRARLDITDESGAVIKTAYVYAKVWDFAIPKYSTVKSAIGMGFQDGYNRRTKTSTDGPVEHYIRYYEYLLDNRLNAWCLPYNPNDERANEWMSDPRVNTFLVAGGYSGDAYNNGMCGGAVDEEAVSAIYEKIKGNEDWMSKALFYMTDEPGVYWDSHDKIGELQGQKAALDRCFPDARIVIPFHVNFWQDQATAQGIPGYEHEHNDVFYYMENYSTVLCPCVRLFLNWEQADKVSGLPDNDVIYARGYYPNLLYGRDSEVEDTYGPMLDRIETFRNKGGEVWWYTANTPRPPMANISQRSTGMMNRVLFWIQFDYNIDGYLYWASEDWPSKKRNTVGEDGGILVYPGDDFGIDGPVACQRTGIARDGLEDYEYLKMAKELLGEEYADSIVRRIVTDLVNFESDSSVRNAVRVELGEAIEAAVNAN